MSHQESQQENQSQEVVVMEHPAGARFYNLVLPIPSPGLYYDNYHHPLFPFVVSAINCFADPVNRPWSFPFPLGDLVANYHNVLGARFHDFGYVNFNPDKLFTKYMLWFFEINDRLFRLICPSDLNDMPCEWDELQGGCQMLRLCDMRHKYPHPHLGQIPPCNPDLLHQCRYIHNIDPTCRGITKPLREPEHERPQWQGCEAVAGGEICKFGHDFESVRIEALYRYWEHKGEARERGSIGFVKRDVLGRKFLRPARPAEFEVVEVEEEVEEEDAGAQ